MQSNGTLCQMLALDILFGLPLEAFEQQTDAIRNMDLARMNAFIRKVLDPAQPRSWSIVRPPRRGVIPRKIISFFPVREKGRIK